MSHTEWLEQRRDVVTATDCLFILKEFNEQLAPKLENVNVWNRTRFQLYMEKVISVQQYLEYQDLIVTPAMQEGKNREEEIANLAKTHLGLRQIEPNGNTLAINTQYKIGATPDYYILNIDAETIKQRIDENNNELQIIEGNYDVFNLGTGILECKLTSNLTDDKLLSYQLQVQQQLLCTGLKWAVIAIAIKESKAVDSLITKQHYYFVKANLTLQQAIIDAAQEFWKWLDDIACGKAEVPQWDRHNERDAILFNIVRNDIEKLAEEYLEAQEAWKHWKYIKNVLQTRITMLLGKTTNNVVITQESGQQIKINQIYTKDTFYAAQDIQNAISAAAQSLERAQSLNVGDIKTPSKLHNLSVEIV